MPTAWINKIFVELNELDSCRSWVDSMQVVIDHLNESVALKDTAVDLCKKKVVNLQAVATFQRQEINLYLEKEAIYKKQLRRRGWQIGGISVVAGGALLATILILK